ncbi:unnamed protein product [Moneuplotes crassus]|uniref:Uncharacterized protein n=1 Tax=Euplotes crassus TaxID=5936 RepID=A0AAD1UIM7_EUPCR|nr:unnamed protein product [Moneuplotes crassus]
MEDGWERDYEGRRRGFEEECGEDVGMNVLGTGRGYLDGKCGMCWLIGDDMLKFYEGMDFFEYEFFLGFIF